MVTIEIIITILILYLLLPSHKIVLDNSIFNKPKFQENKHHRGLNITTYHLPTYNNSIHTLRLQS